MKKRFLNIIGSAAISSAISTAALISAHSVEAVTFGFQNIPTTNISEKIGDGIVGQFTFTIADIPNVSGKTLWTFANVGSVNSFIGQIYFDWKGLSTAPIAVATINAVGTSAGVNFESGSGKLPQGQNVKTLLSQTLGFDNSSGNKDANIVLEADSPGSNKDGIDANQTLAVIFNSGTASSLESLILADKLRVGIHVQGIDPTGGSDAYFDGAVIPPTPPKPVPVPGFVLGIMAAGALGGTRLLKNKKQTV
ncbi:hypothetical protein HCU40_11105 [Pseudanabaena biceps]|nr:hypothetical protein [Pseudanabaena biceps]